MPTSNPCYDLILLYGYCYLFMEGQLPKPGAVQKFDCHFLGSDAPRSCRDETYLMGYFDTNTNWADLQNHGIIENLVFISCISLI